MWLNLTLKVFSANLERKNKKAKYRFLTSESFVIYYKDFLNFFVLIYELRKIFLFKNIIM